MECGKMKKTRETILLEFEQTTNGKIGNRDFEVLVER